MAELMIHPPVHLTMQPDQPIRSLDAALRVVRGYSGERADAATEGLARRLEIAATPAEAEEAGTAFRAWVHARGLLLIRPEDR
jgi:hypothetical protein